MAECRFVGNANARGLKQPDSDLIAIILRGRENPFLSALAEALLAHTQGLKASFLTEFVDELADEFQTALRLSQGNQPLISELRAVLWSQVWRRFRVHEDKILNTNSEF